jgi:zinc transport system substrate-binding protein
MPRWLHAVLAGFLLLALAAPPAAAGPRVVASIKPLHSLVAGVMAGIATPTLLVQGGGSPHSYSLRPSEARALSEADLVFWIGPELETFLRKSLPALAGRAKTLAIAEEPAVRLLDTRAGGAWVDHADDAGHAKDGGDMHLWLDPDNAAAIVRIAGQALAGADRANAERYAANAAAMIERIAALDRDTAARLAPVRDRPYVVFHDAYQYFERHFATAAVGALTLSPERTPGARRLRAIHDLLAERNVVCVFSEPQFKPSLVQTVIAGTAVKAGVLDPLGAALAPGPDAWFQLMDGLAEKLVACLGS